MADYIYLLETRLSPAQRSALEAVREIARSRAATMFLVGGAVRDLTSGSPVRDLDVVVQGNALKFKKDLEKAGAAVSGEHDAAQALYVTFPGGVRMEVGSTLTASYPKPGKPVYRPASLLDDLRRRDFTANAMALSLNEGSYGLLMDPTNGVADIENRELRLVSNYGFIEEPARMIRATRLMARLGWSMEEKTQARYETGKQEGYISAMSSFHRGYETEEIFHEEDPVRVLRRLEEEGWMQYLFPSLLVAKANLNEIERLREAQTELQLHGIQPDPATANFPLLTAKLSPAELAELKAMMPRQGFVGEIERLEAEAKDFVAQMGAKTASLASQAFQLIHRSKPEAVLWAAHTSKSAALQGKLKSFYGEWPQVRQKIPYTLMQEMRIVPELPGYAELLETLFYALLDGRLETVEEMRAFLEPYSPPAPPPPVHLRRSRAAKKDAKGGRGKKKAEVSLDPDEEDAEADRAAADAETQDDGGDAGTDAQDSDAGDSEGGEPDAGEDVAEAEEKVIEEIQPVERKVAAPVEVKAETPAPENFAAAKGPKTAKSAEEARPGRAEAGRGGTATAKMAGATTAKSAQKLPATEQKKTPAETKKVPVVTKSVTKSASKAASGRIPPKSSAKAAAKKGAVKVPATAAKKAPAKGLKAPTRKAVLDKGGASAKKSAPSKPAASKQPAKKQAVKVVAAKAAKKAVPAGKKKAGVKAVPTKKGAAAKKKSR